jgi:type VI secretion system protein VasJ
MPETYGALAELGRTPISPEAPCGKSARYEREYELLEAEIAKLEALTPEPVNWGQVVDAAVAILQAKSKDLLVASYLARGLFERQGYAGLESALTIYRDLIDAYWDGLFPEAKRMRGRLAAISWMAERLGKAIAQRQPAASDGAAVQRCHALAEHIGLLLEGKLGGGAPDLSPLRRPLRDLQARLVSPEQPGEESGTAPQPVVTAPDSPRPPEQPPEAHKPPVQAVTPPPAPNAPPAAQTELATESDAQRALRHCQEIMRNVAVFLRGKNLADPSPYRLLRMATWLLVKELPPSDKGITAIPKAAADPKRYEQLLKAAAYGELIPEVEAGFARAPFWLDAHRLTATALEALGSSYGEARKAVVAELAKFIQRFPGVLELKCADGTPFADDHTRLWIDQEVVERPQQLATADGLAHDGEGVTPFPWVEVAREAKALASRGKFIDGVALLRDGQKGASSERERFLWRLHLARFCFETGHADVAIPQLELLDEHVQRFRLDEWEPGLSLEVAQLLLMSYSKLLDTSPKPEAKLTEQVERLRARLCRLDLVAALATDNRPR